MVVKLNVKIIALVLASLLVMSPGLFSYWHLFHRATGVTDDKGNAVSRAVLIDLTLSREVQRINAEKQNHSTPPVTPPVQ